MVRFGDKLRNAREVRGRSIEALSAETKIQLRHLEALEQEAFHDLPGGIFRRGILRSYLRALDLSEADWMQSFQASLEAHARARGERLEPDAEGWVAFASNVKKNRVTQRRQSYGRWIGVLALAVLLALSGWAVWVFELKH